MTLISTSRQNIPLLLYLWWRRLGHHNTTISTPSNTISPRILWLFAISPNVIDLLMIVRSPQLRVAVLCLVWMEAKGRFQHILTLIRPSSLRRYQQKAGKLKEEGRKEWSEERINSTDQLSQSLHSKICLRTWSSVSTRASIALCVCII